jgi:hypothetical protein
MNTREAFLILAATAAASTVYADKIQFSQAPPAVQQAIRQKAGRQQIEDVIRDNRNGQIVYEANWKSQGGAQQELLVSEAGTILRDAVGASTGLGQQNLTLANKTGVALPETPQAVQTAIHNQIPTSPIDNIQRGIWNGQNVYEITYHDNGRLQTFQVTETGQPVVSQTPVANWQPRYASLADRNVPLSAGAKMAFNAAPEPVRTTVQQMANGARIEDFERGEWSGRTIYQAAFKRNGQNIELQVLDDGSLVSKMPFGEPWSAQAAANAVPRPASVQDPNLIRPLGPAASSVRYAGLSTDNIPLSAGAKMSLAEAPRVVQTTVNAIANGARIEDFERGQWNTRTVYQAAFKRNGQNIELQVLDDGSVLTAEPAAAVGAPATGLTGVGQQQ